MEDLARGVRSALDRTQQARAAAAADVVFVCEHGAVKSVIAANLFNTLAAERGLPLRAVARGITPDVAAVGTLGERMKAEGIDVSTIKPQPLTPDDIAGARRVVAFGDLVPGSRAEIWDGIPAATVQFDASRDAIRARVQALLDELARQVPAEHR